MIPFVGLEGTRDMRCNWIRGLLLTIVLFCGATAVCADAARVPSRPVARMKSGGKVQNLWRQKATTRVVVPAKMSEKRLRPPRSWFVMNMAVVNCLTVSGAALLLLALLKIAFRRSASLREFDREATVPLRGILALLVVVGHLWGYDGKPDNLMQYLSCGPTAVSVFFFMSGYGYEKSFRRKGESYLNGLFGRTLWKLLIPMAIASLVYCVVTIFVMGDFDPWKLLCGYVRGRTGFLPQSWYVYMLMMFAFVVALGRRRIGLIGIWIAVIGIELVVGSVLKWPMCWWASDYAFPVGMTFAACEPRIRSLISGHPVKVYGVALAALLLSAVFSWWFVGTDMVILTRIPNYLLGPVFTLVLYELRLPAPAWIGVISYEIYLCQGTFQRTLLKFGLSSYAYGVVGIVLTVALGAVIHRLGRRIDSLWEKWQSCKAASISA